MKTISYVACEETISKINQHVKGFYSPYQRAVISIIRTREEQGSAIPLYIGVKLVKILHDLENNIPEKPLKKHRFSRHVWNSDIPFNSVI